MNSVAIAQFPGASSSKAPQLVLRNAWDNFKKDEIRCPTASSPTTLTFTLVDGMSLFTGTAKVSKQGVLEFGGTQHAKSFSASEIPNVTAAEMPTEFVKPSMGGFGGTGINTGRGMGGANPYGAEDKEVETEKDVPRSDLAKEEKVRPYPFESTNAAPVEFVQPHRGADSTALVGAQIGNPGIVSLNIVVQNNKIKSIQSRSGNETPIYYEPDSPSKSSPGARSKIGMSIGSAEHYLQKIKMYNSCCPNESVSACEKIWKSKTAERQTTYPEPTSIPETNPLKFAPIK